MSTPIAAWLPEHLPIGAYCCCSDAADYWAVE